MTYDNQAVLVLRMHAPLGWEQNRPGGCRCLCGIYHRGDTGPAIAGGCTAAAEPGLLLRIEAPDNCLGPLPVCRPCYATLVPLTDYEHDGTDR